MRLYVSLLTALSVLTPIAASAAPVAIKGTIVPRYFCEGKRETDGKLYKPFIDEFALSQYDAAQMQDPVIRETARRAKAEAWSGQVRRGQAAKCGKASF